MYLGKVIGAEDIDRGVFWIAAVIEILQLVEIYKEDDAQVGEAFSQHGSQESPHSGGGVQSPQCGGER